MNLRFTLPGKSLVLIAFALVCTFMASAQYCNPNFGTGCSSDDDINTFVLQGINSTAIVDSNTGCSANAYDNRISESVTLAAGGSYTGYINSDFTSPDENMQVFIDLNNDGTLSTTESVGGVNGIDNIGTNFTITIPSGTASGSYRMRVVLSFDYTYPTISPCPVYTSFYSYGEVHDYTVVIGTGGTTICAAPTGLASSSVTSTSAALSWTAVTGSVGYEYVLNQSLANPTGAGTAITGTTYSAASLSPGTTYYFHLRNKCSATSFSSWVSTSFTTSTATPCAGPSTVSSSNIAAHTATISWTAVTGSIGYEYAVTTAATPPASGTPATGTTAAVSGLSSSSIYRVYVRNKCASGTYSAWSSTTFTTPVAAGVSTVQGQGDIIATVSPNPVTDKVTISFSTAAPAGTFISVYDFTGKLVLKASITTKDSVIDMTSYTPGIYFLKISGGQYQQTLKITKE